jgi:hypothetical protein
MKPWRRDWKQSKCSLRFTSLENYAKSQVYTHDSAISLLEPFLTVDVSKGISSIHDLEYAYSGGNARWEVKRPGSVFDSHFSQEEGRKE